MFNHQIMSSHLNGGKMNTSKISSEEKKSVLRCFWIGLFLIIVSVNGLHAAIPASEREALIALYNATNGDNWTRNFGWKDGTLEADGFGPSGTEGDWYGVDVSGDSVSAIILTYNNLTGSIPMELTNLSNLKKLYLDSNQIGGSIPPELGDLSTLEMLFLGFNDNMSGSIPSELGKLTNLKELYLSSLNLSGNIPPELGDLSNLTNLELRSNNLSGNIPSELGKLTNVTNFELQNNNLSGNIPSELGNLTNVSYISLYGNNLNGNIPPELGNLSNLETLSLGSNQLNGNIPPELGNLSNLDSLYLNSNQLSGRIPSELGKLTKFEGLSLYNNKLNGNIPSELGNLTILETLELNHNNLSGEIPTSLTNLINMDDLDIGYNCLTTNDNTLKEWLATHDSDWADFQCDTEPPFGSFDSPMQGSTARSSIAVTGWTLDNWGIESVKIYREQGNILVFIGDAILVEGARPDVAALYPGYPNNTKAGWGYMMLTNFLPNGGNGTIVLHAIATDTTGQTTTLGTKNITLDNANAVKPFGAIDTPTQGGSASGSSYVNFGWALTPQPNTIPVDGSTISVWVNGEALGNPVYNIYRSDIATLFPGYNNSNAAIGYFYLDTTKYTNGVHTIQWTVKDDAENSDGIGSRYFSIQNSSPRTSAQTHAREKIDIQIQDIPLDNMSSIKVKTGYNPKDSNQANRDGDIGINQIEIPELGRLELSLNGKTVEEESNPGTSYVGYQLVANGLRPLPPGSYLDKKRGIFYWQAGVAFVGNYQLVFIKTDGSGSQTRQEVTVTIKPKQ
jgi:Leucine-rich repeat (LRR) protein